MSINRIFIGCLAIMALCVQSSFAQCYSYRDKNGKVHTNATIKCGAPPTRLATRPAWFRDDAGPRSCG
jgi:hypothetical protein